MRNQPCSARKITIIMAITIMAGCWPFEGHAEEGGILRGVLKERLVSKLKDKATEGAEASTIETITKAGDYTFSVSWDGLERHYKVHVPKSYNPTKATPMVLAFHGGGGDMEYMSKDNLYGLISKSEQTGYIVVFPSGYSKFKSGKFATWNAGNCCADARDKNIDDVGFVRQIVSNLTTQLNIDRNKIYATGMSNGGMMSHRLACDAADIFKAVASVAGTDGTKTCNPSRPVSVLHIHALDDDHVLFNGGAGEGSFRDPSKVTEFTSVPETISRWVERDHCIGLPKRVLQVDGAYCDVYLRCSGGAQVKLCVTSTGGHSWPGGNKPRADIPPSQAISANDQIWRFFENTSR
ncbi:MAG: alpha/beta hydrolase-fold protein [Alphaproteobacteria bacterium]|nr:alpha/beta hydrolase-fold protein [Alphaproteobacteria bacterium]